MDKRRLRLILLVVVGIIILVIGIGAAKIYSTPSVSKEALNVVSQQVFHKNYDELAFYEQLIVGGHFPPLPTMHEKNVQFTQWLVKPLKWVAIAFGLFAILTAALVVSRLILNKTRPPSTPR
jgi:hypothetical protein